MTWKYLVLSATLLGTSAIAEEAVITTSEQVNYTVWGAGRLTVRGNANENIVLEFEGGSDRSLRTVRLLVGARTVDLTDVFRAVRYSFPNRVRIHFNARGAVALDMPFSTSSGKGCSKISVTVVDGKVFSSQISADLQSSCLF